MEVRLHIGAHRTGTTRLQQELGRRAAHLATRGIAAHWAEGLRPDSDPLFPLLAGAGSLGRRWPTETVRRLRDARNAAEASGRRLVVSEENYAGSIEAMVRSGVIYPRIRQRLAMLAPAMAGDKVVLLFSIRSYGGFFASLYAQQVRRQPMPPFETLKPGMLALKRRWPQVLSDAAAAIPGAELLVWPFEDMPGRGIEALRQVLGERRIVAVNEDMPAVLPSATAPAIEILNRMTAPEELKRDARRAVILAHPRPEHPPFDPWTAAERAHLDADYAEDLEKLRVSPPAHLRMISLDAEASDTAEARHA
ncbi:hypothetical protein ACW9UR_03055 [Halovulum sp. GXIMD14794]